MKKLTWFSLLLAALLSGCAMLPYELKQSSRPIVGFDGTKPTVSPNVLRFPQGEKEIQIVWTLSADAKIRFSPKDGLVIDGELKGQTYTVPRGSDERRRQAGLIVESGQQEIVDCKISEDRLQATCLNHHRYSGLFKYTIRLTDGKTDFIVDPFVDNW